MTATHATDATDAATLSARLRAETAAAHQTAETTPFIRDLTGGSLTLDDYTRYLGQLAHVYGALEERLAQPGDPDFVHDPRLHRHPAIQADLRALGVTDPERQHPPLPETADYVDRIHAASPARYVAHHYTRYLGDLAGGQVIARMVAQHYAATPEQLSFTRFAHIDKPVVFRREYRDALDGAKLSLQEQEEAITEAKLAFGANSALFAALARP